MNGPTAARRELNYAISELEWVRKMLLDIGPATDSAERARWKVQALERAIDLLRQPQYEVNPLQ